MSNEVAIYEGMSHEDLMKALGQDGGSDSLPSLKVNPDFCVVEDGKEYTLEPGSFKIDTAKGTVYSVKAKGIRFRPMLQTYQYIRYDDNAPNPKSPKGKGAFVDRSTQESSFRNTEFLSERGGQRCGKTKETEGLTASQAAVNKQTSCYRLVYGTVSFTGRDLAGAEVEVQDQPCVLKLRGTNFMPFGDEVEKVLQKAKKPFPCVELAITTSPKKNGATTYYLLSFTFDKAQSLPLTAEVFATIGRFKDTVDFSNKKVLEKHKAVLRGEPTAQDAADKELAEDLSRDMPDDELPF